MLIGRSLLLTFVFLTFILAATTTNIPTSKPLLKSSSTTNKKFESSVILNSLSTSVANQNECQEPCSIDYCLKYKSINSNCTRLILDQCNCCIVCLRSENQICGGHLNVYGLCEPDLLCYKPNKTSNNPDKQTGICVKACLKFQCLLVNINNKTKCECADRRVPCNVNFQQYKNDDNKTRYYCEQQTLSNQERELSLLKTNDGKLHSIFL